MNQFASNVGQQQSWAIPAPGDLIAGKYTVQSTVGRGAIAVVLAALHGGLDRRVAIKLLLPEWAFDAEIVERFVREGRMATHIRSEHVVRVFDVGTLESGAPYQVLEFLDGKNLDEIVATSGRVPVEVAVDWILQACEAIGEAHTLGVVHRDIKPSNLVLTARADGKASIKVIDFGLSKLTATHAMNFKDERPLTMANDVMGTPHYMAPEQLRSSRDVDGRVDIWALGAVLHELIAARPPFLGASVPALCASILSEPPARLSDSNPNIPPELERAVLTCLEKDPRDRFATVAEFATAIAPFRSATSIVQMAPVERAVERVPSVRPERLELVIDDPSETELLAAAPLVPNLVIDLHATALYGTYLPGPAEPAPATAVPETMAPVTASLGAEPPGGDLHITPLPPMPTFDPELMRASWPNDLDPVHTGRRVPGTHSSARVVLLSCLILAGLGSAAFASLYSSVHHGDTASVVGLTSPQANTGTPLAIPPVPSPDTSALSATSPLANPAPGTPPQVAPIAAPVVAAPAAAPAPVPAPAVVQPAATPAPVSAMPFKAPAVAPSVAPAKTHAHPAPRHTHAPATSKTRKTRSWTLEPTPTPTPTASVDGSDTSSSSPASAPAETHDDAPAPKAPASEDPFGGGP